MSPKLKVAVPQFKVQIYRTETDRIPTLKIDWKSEVEGKVVQRISLILQDGQKLYDYIQDMIQYNIKAYSMLLEFSRNFLKKDYPSIHRIIANQN